MNNMSNFFHNHYHPLWEENLFTEIEYEKEMKELYEKKKNQSYLYDGRHLKVVGFATKIWQNIRGWFGFEDQTDPIKVNYQLLKLLQYGETHHFLQKPQIETLVTKLRENLVKDSAFKNIHSYIHVNQISENSIKEFYENHQAHLKEAFWTNLFHHHTEQSQKNPAFTAFNLGKIFLAENKFEQAIESLNSAKSQQPQNAFFREKLVIALMRKFESEDTISEKILLLRNASKEILEIQALDPTTFSYLREYFESVSLKPTKELPLSSQDKILLSKTAYENLSDLYKYSPDKLTEFKEALEQLKLPLSDQPAKTYNPHLVEQHSIPSKAETSNIQTEKPPTITQATSFFNTQDPIKAPQKEDQKHEVLSETDSRFEELITKAKEKKNSEEALILYEEALSLGNDALIESTCESLLHQAASLSQKNPDLSLKYCHLAVKYGQKVHRNSNNEITSQAHMLLRELYKNNDPIKADHHLRQALALTTDANELFLKPLQFALVSRNESFDISAQSYKKIAEGGETTKNLRKNLFKTHVEVAERFDAEPMETAEKTKELIGELSKMATTATFAEKIKTSLGKNLRSYSPENLNLRALQIVSDHPDEYFKQGQQLIFLLNTAYDGKLNHMNADEMPLELRDKILKLESELFSMSLYYNLIKDRIETIFTAYPENLNPDDFTALNSFRSIEAVKNVLNENAAEYPLAEFLKHFNGGWKSLALHFYQEALKLDPFNEQINAKAGNIYLLLDSFEDSKQSYETALKANPSKKEYKKALFWIQSILGDQDYYKNLHLMQSKQSSSDFNEADAFKKTIALYEKAYQYEENEYSDHYSRLIDAYVKSGDPLKAATEHEKLQKKYPNQTIEIDPSIYLKRFDAMFEAKKFDEALKLIEQLLTKSPYNLVLKEKKSRLYYEIGRGYAAKSMMQEAYDHFLKATNFGVDAPANAYINLAKIYMNANQSKKPNITIDNSSSILNLAQKNLEKAVALLPKDPIIRFQLARLAYIDDHSSIDGEKHLKEAHSLDPKNPTYLYALISWIEMKGTIEYNQSQEFNQLKQEFLKLYSQKKKDKYWEDYPL